MGRKVHIGPKYPFCAYFGLVSDTNALIPMSDANVVSMGRETSPCDEKSESEGPLLNLTPDHKVHVGSDPDSDCMMRAAEHRYDPLCDDDNQLSP